ncbi:MAG: hypothetical protein GXO87_07285 [Chlorobi bacterium]|nr:hypothetical protein [Chlorobiota bacterium]
MRRLSVIFVGLIFFTNVSAQNFNDALRIVGYSPESNARAVGMGNAFDAVSDNYSATYFNPAGLAQIRYFEISTGFEWMNKNTETAFLNNSYQSKKDKFSFNEMGFVFPVSSYGGNFVFSMGYNRRKNFINRIDYNGYNQNSSLVPFLTASNDDLMYELALSYPIYNGNDYLYDKTIIDGRMQQSGYIDEYGYLDNWSVAFASKIGKDLSWGITFNYIAGSYHNEHYSYEEDVNNYYDRNTLTDPAEPSTADFQNFYLRDILDWSTDGWEAKLGILFEARKNWKISGTIKFPGWTTIKEDYYVEGKSRFGTGASFSINPPYLNKVQYTVQSPFEFTMGSAYKLSYLLFSGQVQFIDYYHLRFSNGYSSFDIGGRNAEIQDMLTGAFNYNVGLEFLIPNLPVKLRGGFIYQTSPFKNDPAEYDKKYFTMGLGIGATRTMELNLAYVHGWTKNFGDLYGAGEARYFTDNSANKLMMTFNFRY